MDGLTVDHDEIVAAARRLSDAASTPWRPVGACTEWSPVLAAVRRLSEAWTRGHAVLVADASAARDTLLAALDTYDAADAATAQRLHAVERVAAVPQR